MKNKSLEILAQRREQLVARCNAQREVFATQNQGVTGALSGIDLGMRLVQRVKQSPIMMAALVAAVVVIKPLRIIPLVRAGLGVWQTVRSMRQQRAS